MESPASNQSPVVPVAIESEKVTPPSPALDFRALYDSQFRYVWHSLRRLGVRDRDLEDLCHDVFVAFWRGQHGYDSERPIRPWLFGIAFRVTSDYRRRAPHRLEIPGDRPDFPSPAQPADEQLSRRESRQMVMTALETLDLDRRAVFVMHDLDEHTMPEIAAVLKVPLNTLYSRLRLARADFTAAVRRQQQRGT